MSIGVSYPDKYAVEETFQLLKIPWEWYESDRHYDVVIAHKTDVPDYTGNLINLAGNDFFKRMMVLSIQELTRKILKTNKINKDW